MATLDDIAVRAGVTRNTVSRALRGLDLGVRRDATERAEHIRRLAKSMGYRPNAAAQSTRTGRFGSLALLLSTYRSRSYLPARMLDGIQDEVAQRDLALSLAKVPDERLCSSGYMPRILRHTMSDGLLIDYTDLIPPEMIRLIEAHEIPSVWINTLRETDCVRPDEMAGGGLAVSRLRELGHARIAYADFTYAESLIGEAHFSRRMRREGYEQAMREAGLVPRIFSTEVGSVGDEVARRADALVTHADRPTAVLVYGGEEATALLWAAQARGVRVPDDLSIVAFAGDTFTAAGRTINTVISPHYQLGAAAVRMLVSKIDDPVAESGCETIPYQWSEGASVAPVIQ